MTNAEFVTDIIISQVYESTLCQSLACRECPLASKRHDFECPASYDFYEPRCYRHSDWLDFRKEVEECITKWLNP